MVLPALSTKKTRGVINVLCVHSHVWASQWNDEEGRRALARIDYAGPPGFEAFSGGIAGSGLAAGMALWRRMRQDSDELARHGREFILREWDAARRALDLDGIGTVHDVRAE